MESVLRLPGDLPDGSAGYIPGDWLVVDFESVVIASQGLVVFVQLVVNVYPVRVRHLVDDILSGQGLPVGRVDDFVL